jgi:two-component system cell cycle response regulator/two-component system chemotaxis response regulator CheY
MAFKILTVDDSRTIRMIVKKAFSAYECELFEAEDGSEGLDLASKVKPDLIILDITMPVMTGVEMLTKLKENDDLKAIPVIMLTAESGKDNVMNIVKMGVTDYMVKPFKGNQLIDRAVNILALKPTIGSSAMGKEEANIDLFSADGSFVTLTLPKKISRSIAAQIETVVKSKLPKFSAAGAKKIILIINQVADLNMTAIQLIITVVNLLVRAKMLVRLVAADNQISALSSFKETGLIETLNSIEEAKASF